MACVNHNCSGCCTGCNNGCARRSCSSCSSCGRSACNGGNRMGALRSVTGPFSNCGNWWGNSPDFPFYTGPCGYPEYCNDGYPPYPPVPPLPPVNCSNVGANFSAGAPITLTAGNAVNLSRTSNPSDAFSVTSEGIRIFCPGVYMVLYTVNIPEDATVSSVFALTLNGTRVPASSTNVVTADDAVTDSYTMHTLVQANSGDLLSLVSLSDVSIATTSSVNIFTLTIVKVA